MSHPFVTFRSFTEKEQVEVLGNLLRLNKIPFEISEGRSSLDALYGGSQFDRTYYVKLRQTDFSRADALLQEFAAQSLDAVDKDHYLFTFANEELLEILQKRDEWSELDYQLARKILNDRGQIVPYGKLEEWESERNEDLAKPETKHGMWIILGYASALGGGLLGIFIGWYLCTFKKTLPDGRVVYGHTAKERQHGQIMIAIGVGVLIVLGILAVNQL